MPNSVIDFQIMWNWLIAVVEEQATTLVRTAFSTSVREAGDLSAGLFDRRGRMIAQAVTGTPGHVNAMAESVGHFIRAIGRENIFEDDDYITNDPWMGTGHLHDITMVSPAFRAGALIGFFACTAHVVDIGGRGFGPDGNEVYEEGLQIPIMKFAERGDISQTLLSIVRANVREPDQVIGDLYSLAACNAAGDKRLQEMLHEFEIADIEGLSDYIIETSGAATREAIARVRSGSYCNVMEVDGYDAPVHMEVKLTIDGETLTADFARTSGPSKFGVNVPVVYTRAYACYGLKCAIAPTFQTTTGPWCRSILSPPKGASWRPSARRRFRSGTCSGHRCLTSFWARLSRPCRPSCRPKAQAPCGISRSLQDQVEGREGRATQLLMFNSGGTGARPTLDGLSATAFPSGVKTMSVEATEQVGPIVVWRKDLREGSGGAGEFRGGLGQTIEIEPCEGYEFYFNAMFDRIENPARGRNGGFAGAPGSVRLSDGTQLKGKGRQKVGAGQRLVLSLPGGGGFGNPRRRVREQVRADVNAGYISREQAKSEYGLED